MATKNSGYDPEIQRQSGYLVKKFKANNCIRKLTSEAFVQSAEISETNNSK